MPLNKSKEILEIKGWNDRNTTFGMLESKARSRVQRFKADFWAR